MKIAVCDDEKEIRDTIEKNIRLLYKDAEVLLFENGSDLLSCDELIDILFLDIQMEEPNGIETARLLRKAGNDVTIVFVTAIEEYVFQAFDVKAFHYLLKPLDTVKFYEVLKGAVEDRKRTLALQRIERASITVKTGAVTRRIFLGEIIYLEIFNRKVTLHTTDEKIEFYGKLSQLEESLGEDFVRCHRAFIVNLRYVAKYDASFITLENGQTVYLAKKKYADFVKKYMNWLRRAQKAGE